jgi:hypothetical protein
MKTKDFAFVGAKIVGIILFIKGIQMLIYAVNVWVTDPLPYSSKHYTLLMINYFIPAIAFLCMSLILWRFTNRILKFFLPKENNVHEASVDKRIVELKDLQIAAFSVLGLVILSDAIIKIFSFAAEILARKDFYFQASSRPGIRPITIQLFIKTLGHLIYLGIGIYLVFGIRNFFAIIGKGISKLRKDTGVDDETGEDNDNVEAYEKQ